MNKEEKEAIERLNRKLTSEKFTKNIGMPVYIKDIELVLNLIEKQSKEIENLIKENKALKEGLKYRVNYCKLLEKELYANGVNYEFEKTEIEKQFLEEGE